LHEVVADFHLQDGADARERVDHDTDERAVAQAGEVGRLMYLAVRAGGFDDGDAVEQSTSFVDGEHRRLTFLHYILRAAHGMGRVDFENVARYQPVEQHPHGGQVLFHRGWRDFALQVLDERGDMKGLDADQFGQPVGLAPAGKTAGGIEIGFAGAVVIDLGGEEFDKAQDGLGVRCEYAGWLEFRRGRKSDGVSLCKLFGVELCTLFGVLFKYGPIGGTRGRGPKARP